MRLNFYLLLIALGVLLMAFAIAATGDSRNDDKTYYRSDHDDRGRGRGGHKSDSDSDDATPNPPKNVTTSGGGFCFSSTDCMNTIVPKDLAGAQVTSAGVCTNRTCKDCGAADYGSNCQCRNASGAACGLPTGTACTLQWNPFNPSAAPRVNPPGVCVECDETCGTGGFVAHGKCHCFAPAYSGTHCTHCRCKNGGTCTPYSSTCTCPGNYTGALCETPCGASEPSTKPSKPSHGSDSDGDDHKPKPKPSGKPSGKPSHGSDSDNDHKPKPKPSGKPSKPSHGSDSDNDHKPKPKPSGKPSGKPSHGSDSDGDDHKPNPKPSHVDTPLFAPGGGRCKKDSDCLSQDLGAVADNGGVIDGGYCNNGRCDCAYSYNHTLATTNIGSRCQCRKEASCGQGYRVFSTRTGERLGCSATCPF